MSGNKYKKLNLKIPALVLPFNFRGIDPTYPCGLLCPTIQNLETEVKMVVVTTSLFSSLRKHIGFR